MSTRGIEKFVDHKIHPNASNPSKKKTGTKIKFPLFPKKKNNCNILDIPKEVLTILFSYIHCSHADLLRISHVCKKWHESFSIINVDETLCKQYLFRLYTTCSRILTKNLNHVYLQTYWAEKRYRQVYLSKSSFKIVVLGGANSGKSSFLQRYVNGEWNDRPRREDPTISVEYRKKSIISGQNVNLDLIEYYPSYYDVCQTDESLIHLINYGDGLFIALPLTDNYTLQSVEELCEKCEKILGIPCERLPIVLLGTKSDDAEDRQIKNEEIEQICAYWKLKYVETSAKENANIELAFETLFQVMHEKYFDWDAMQNETIDYKKEFIHNYKVPERIASKVTEEITEKKKNCIIM